MAKKVITMAGALLLVGAALLLGGCSNGQSTIQESSIAAGLYVGDRECSTTITTVNGVEVEQVDTDTLRVTINNSGLSVVGGETIHVGTVVDRNAGTVTTRSVIEEIAASSDGFTIDWGVTMEVDGGSLSGFTLESYKAVGPNTMEVRATILLLAEGVNLSSECVAVLSR